MDRSKVRKYFPIWFDLNSQEQRWLYEIIYHCCSLELFIKKVIVKFFLGSRPKLKISLFNELFLESSLGFLSNILFKAIKLEDKKKIATKLKEVIKMRNQVVHPTNPKKIIYKDRNIFSQNNIDQFTVDVGSIISILLAYLPDKSPISHDEIEEFIQDQIKTERLADRKAFKNFLNQSL